MRRLILIHISVKVVGYVEHTRNSKFTRPKDRTISKELAVEMGGFNVSS